MTRPLEWMWQAGMRPAGSMALAALRRPTVNTFDPLEDRTTEMLATLVTIDQEFGRALWSELTGEVLNVSGTIHAATQVRQDVDGRIDLELVFDQTTGARELLWVELKAWANETWAADGAGQLEHYRKRLPARAGEFDARPVGVSVIVPDVHQWRSWSTRPDRVVTWSRVVRCLGTEARRAAAAVDQFVARPAITIAPREEFAWHLTSERLAMNETPIDPADIDAVRRARAAYERVDGVYDTVAAQLFNSIGHKRERGFVEDPNLATTRRASQRNQIDLFGETWVRWRWSSLAHATDEWVLEVSFADQRWWGDVRDPSLVLGVVFTTASDSQMAGHARLTGALDAAGFRLPDVRRDDVEWFRYLRAIPIRDCVTSGASASEQADALAATAMPVLADLLEVLEGAGAISPA